MLAFVLIIFEIEDLHDYISWVRVELDNLMKRFIAPFLFFIMMPVVFAWQPKAQNVIVVANENEPDSLKIAQHYMKAREIPKGNLIVLPMSRDEEVTWTEFVKTIYNPLEAQLAKMQRIVGYDSNSVDEIGRTHFIPVGHKIDFLVVCKGVPLKIKQDPHVKLSQAEKDIWEDELEINLAAVDSELSLLAYPDPAIVGYIDNPLYGSREPTDDLLQRVVMVSRLDGPTEESVIRMIDNALIAERDGLMGRAYVDLEGRDRKNNRSLELTVAKLDEMGFDLTVHRSRGDTFGPDARFDAPAFYFGCWTKDKSSPIKDRRFLFPAGAIGVHLSDSSAHTLHSGTEGWAGPLIEHGITGTVGNVFDPHGDLSHRTDMLVDLLSRGKTLGEAAYYALPALSWQSILVGDPLYRPFKLDLAFQIKNASANPSWLGQYAVIRKMRLLEEVGLLDEAAEVGHKYLKQFKGLALAFVTAQLQFYEELADEAVKTLEFTQTLTSIQDQEQILASDIAEFYVRLHENKKAINVYKILIDHSTMSQERLAYILPEAMRLAWRSGEGVLAMKWAEQLSKF